MAWTPAFSKNDRCHQPTYDSKYHAGPKGSVPTREAAVFVVYLTSTVGPLEEVGRHAAPRQAVLEALAVAFFGLARRAETATAAAMRIDNDGAIRRIYGTADQQCGHDRQAAKDFHIADKGVEVPQVYCQPGKQGTRCGNCMSAPRSPDSATGLRGSLPLAVGLAKPEFPVFMIRTLLQPGMEQAAR